MKEEEEGRERTSRVKLYGKDSEEKKYGKEAETASLTQSYIFTMNQKNYILKS